MASDTRRIAATLSAAIVLPLSGCMTTPGQTVTMVGSTPVSIAFEYTRHYPTEMQAAMSQAQAYCAQQGRNASIGSTSPAGANPIDRVVTTFNCVQ